MHTKVGLTEKTAVPVAVHRYPAVAKTTEVHLVRSDEAVSMRPMTLEEAIKEAHFRDRDVFVFRDPKGKVMVLHRTRDGKMELDRSAVKAGFRLRLSGFSKTQCRDDCVHPHLHESVNRFTDCAPGQGPRNCV